MRSVLLVAVVLVAGTARGEVLLVEASSRFEATCCAENVFSIFWRPYEMPNVSLSWLASEGTVGIPQRMEIAPSHFINNAYRASDFAVGNPFGVKHWFELGSLGFVKAWTVTPQEFLTNGVYDVLGGQRGLEIATHFSPPNGNSFLGTDYRFTAAELTVNELQYGDNFEVPHIFDFTMRFYIAAPEPTSALPLILCSFYLHGFMVRRRARPFRVG
jgi:hypothetical protein